jgi:phosphoadenosine phosphosulfate reductase
MQRCGIDAYALRADKDIEKALAGLSVFSETYQAAADQPQPLFRRRQRRHRHERPAQSRRPGAARRLAARVDAARALLHEIADDFSPAAFASSLGAEDMVLTDLIVREADIEIFSLDTGRLPVETYDLIAEVKKHYGLALRLYYPRHDLVEAYTHANGINAFYESVELRKGCCFVRKVEPLQRALAGRKAWITGMRAQQAATRDGLPMRSFDAANGWRPGKVQPARRLERTRSVGLPQAQRGSLQCAARPFYPSIGCAPCTRPITPGEDVRAGRWWWENPESRECGLHVKRAESRRPGPRTACPASVLRTPKSQVNHEYCNALQVTPGQAFPPRLAGIRGHPHHARGRRPVQQPGAALLRRQGLDLHAAHRRKGLPPGPLSVSRCCTSIPATTTGRSPTSATGARPNSASG